MGMGLRVLDGQKDSFFLSFQEPDFSHSVLGKVMNVQKIQVKFKLRSNVTLK
jgi:hypothetical protein